jgi:hypothetical protein
MEDGRYVPHVYDTSTKTPTKAGMQCEQWEANHKCEEQELHNEGGCNNMNISNLLT